MKRVKCFRQAFIICILILMLAYILSISSVAHASYSLRIDNFYQIADGVNNVYYNDSFDPMTSQTAPLYRDTGKVEINGAWTQSIASADYGTLRAWAQRGSTNTKISAYVLASASFLDKWTISKEDLNGEQGKLSLWVDVDGSITGPIAHPYVSPGSGWGIRLLEDSYSDIGSWDYSNNAPRLNYHGYMKELNFTYGQPFDVGLTLMIAANQGNDSTVDSTVDYLNSVKLNLEKSLVLNADNQKVTGFNLFAESGHNYNAVPIPGALWLLGSGLLGIFGIRRRFINN